jgi:hypothetical protein
MMASLRQAAQADMSGWGPVPAQAPQAIPQTPPDPTANRNPNMLAAMPLMASTNDALSRQFYGSAYLPSYRILPAKKGSET